MTKLKVLDLFSGIGGFSLGLERTGGFETVAFCEIEEFPRKVLAKHWPDVPCYEDVRNVTKERLAADGIAVDVITGGFPCQDISYAGPGAGLAGKRSGLWFEFHRLIDEVGPRWAIIENVPALRSRGFSTILQNLSKIGYDAEWHCVPASYVGASHQRDRIWVVANPNGSRCAAGTKRRGRETWSNFSGGGPGAMLANSEGFCGGPGFRKNGQVENGHQPPNGGKHVANAFGDGLENGISAAGGQSENGKPKRQSGGVPWLEDGGQSRPFGWLPEPDVGRVAYGVPRRVDRLKGLGNAVVPQIPEMIGRAILEAEATP